MSMTAPNPNSVRWLERLLLAGAFAVGGWWLQNSYLGYLALRKDMADFQTMVAGEYVKRDELGSYFADVRARQDRLEDLMLQMLRERASTAPQSTPERDSPLQGTPVPYQPGDGWTPYGQDRAGRAD